MVHWSVRVCGHKEEEYSVQKMDDETSLNAISVESKAVGFDAKTSDIWV